MDGKRCLSIQSHVVHGYVGNKSATFPLQLLGFDVDAINSCQLSSHTGYRTFKGEKLHGDQLLAILQGLEENGLMGAYSHVLTGYVSTPSFLEAIAAAVRTIRRLNPGAVYVCDPVMGDHGKLYVPAGTSLLFRCFSCIHLLLRWAQRLASVNPSIFLSSSSQCRAGAHLP